MTDGQAVQHGCSVSAGDKRTVGIFHGTSPLGLYCQMQRTCHACVQFKIVLADSGLPGEGEVRLLGMLQN